MLCYPSRASTTYRYPLSAMADALRADPVPTVSVASSTLPYLAPYPAPYPAPHPAPYLTPYRGALTAHPSPTLALTPSIKPSWRRPTELVPLTYRSTAIIDGGQTAVLPLPPNCADPAWRSCLGLPRLRGCQHRFECRDRRRWRGQCCDRHSVEAAVLQLPPNCADPAWRSCLGLPRLRGCQHGFGECGDRRRWRGQCCNRHDDMPCVPRRLGWHAG